MCGGLETANERDSEVEVVHGCLTEGGNSILRVFSFYESYLLASYCHMICKEVHVCHTR